MHANYSSHSQWFHIIIIIRRRNFNDVKMSSQILTLANYKVLQLLSDGRELQKNVYNINVLERNHKENSCSLHISSFWLSFFFFNQYANTSWKHNTHRHTYWWVNTLNFTANCGNYIRIKLGETEEVGIRRQGMRTNTTNIKVILINPANTILLLTT